MTVDDLTNRVREHCKRHASQLQLRRDQVQVEYVLNWGGFVAASFTVSDGQRQFHLKLSSDHAGQCSLQRWANVAGLLSDRYHAPGVLGWIDVDSTDYSGLLFDRIDGTTPDLKRDRELFNEIAHVVGRLHRDAELAQRVEAYWKGGTHLEAFRSRYIETFREDLATIAPSLPPFVSQKTFEWMRSETDRLELLAIESGAFAKHATTPTHWDLWANNILVTTSGDWFLLDWDDLSLGDPALDYATLGWPLMQGHNAIEWQELPIAPSDEHFSERMSLYKRTLTLDWVIDVLADWIECKVAPQHLDVVRDKKRRDHLHYLAMYQDVYG